MAEAAVADRESTHRFYCHMCDIKFEAPSTPFTCPQCSDGFIEQVTSGMRDADHMHPDSPDVISDTDDEMFDVIFGDTAPQASAGGGNLRTNMYDNLIQEFIVNLGVNMFGGNGNMQLFLNPGDYAWGREGLDAIVTQLLNQIDTAGPPPLAKDVIDAIPVVEVTREQVDAKLKCSVCWEEFQIAEKVRQLACQHVYHEPCIRPWLELHSTCPICRQDLGADEQAAAAGPDNSGGNTFNTLQQLFQAVHGGAGGLAAAAAAAADSSTSSNESGSSRSSNSSSNSDNV